MDIRMYYIFIDIWMFYIIFCLIKSRYGEYLLIYLTLIQKNLLKQVE